MLRGFGRGARRQLRIMLERTVTGPCMDLCGFGRLKSTAGNLLLRYCTSMFISWNICNIPLI